MLAEQMFSAFTNQLNSGVIILDLNYRIVMWNRFVELHANKKCESFVDMPIFDVFPELPQRWFERKVGSVIQLKSPSFCSWEQRHHLFEFPHTRPMTTDSLFMAQNCTFLPIDISDELSHICVLIEDMTDVSYYQSLHKAAMKELELATRIDGLTQAYNRKYWQECLVKQFAHSARHKHNLGLVMFDLDNFKLLNDNYGHQCGDLVLIETAKRVQKLLRIGDVFGRYGGEEFAIILPSTDCKGAIEVAERVRSIIETAPILFEDQIIDFSVSVGVAFLDENITKHEALISAADAALYRAKNAGRNQIALCENMELNL